jgi:hypothetical protein
MGNVVEDGDDFLRFYVEPGLFAHFTAHSILQPFPQLQCTARQ